ncbi:MAG: hypothetical protein F6K19_35030 [Cyanothece sp. SIO1E1]|nr:hypothetical protein [Cyanothece sp. SIO1E1]
MRFYLHYRPCVTLPALWLLSMGAGAIALKGPQIFTIPAIMLGAASGIVAYQESEKLKAKDWGAEAWDIALCLGKLSPSQRKPKLVQYDLSGMPDFLLDWLKISTVDATTSGFWTAKRARASKIYVGARGSGKSYLVNHHCTLMAADGIDLKISDRHYPNGDHEWLPGIPRDVFEDRFLVRDADDTHGALMHLQATLHNRIEGISKSTKPKHLVIDEWCGLLRKWDKKQIKSAVDGIAFIFDEGRKYGIDVSVVAHGLTREKTELNEAVTGAADLYIMGDAISQTTYTYPASLARERDGLLDARQRLISEAGIPQRVLIYRDAIAGEATAVVAPDLSVPARLNVPDYLAKAAVDPNQAWLDENAETIRGWLSEGLSLRKMSEQLGLQRSEKKDPRYKTLKQFIADQGIDIVKDVNEEVSDA